MPNVIANHRARIVGEAVVSAYIHELAQSPSRPLDRAGVPAVPSPREIVSSSGCARSHRRVLAPRRRRPLELVA